MLAKPERGWSNIIIGNWSDRCSYLDDVPVMLLKSITDVCENHHVCATEFDAEGWSYIIVFGDCETHIITEKKDGWTLSTQVIDIKELAGELINDIVSYEEDWVDWNPNLTKLKGHVRNCRYLNLRLLIERIKRAIE